MTLDKQFFCLRWTWRIHFKDLQGVIVYALRRDKSEKHVYPIVQQHESVRVRVDKYLHPRWNVRRHILLRNLQTREDKEPSATAISRGWRADSLVCLSACLCFSFSINMERRRVRLIAEIRRCSKLRECYQSSAAACVTRPVTPTDPHRRSLFKPVSSSTSGRLLISTFDPTSADTISHSTFLLRQTQLPMKRRSSSWFPIFFSFSYARQIILWCQTFAF